MTNEERFKAIFQDQVNRPGADDLLEWLESAGFFTAPASTKYHGEYPGGLVEHSLRVYDFMISSPYAAGTSAETRAICALLHDVCKALCLSAFDTLHAALPFFSSLSMTDHTRLSIPLPCRTDTRGRE